MREEILPHFRRLWRPLPDNLLGDIEIWLGNMWLFPPGHNREIPGFLAQVELLRERGVRDVIAAIADIGFVYYRRMIDFRKDKLEELNMVVQHAGQQPDFAFDLNLGLRAGQMPDNVGQYLALLLRNRADSRDNLNRCLDALVLFRDEVTVAFNADALDEQLLRSLRVIAKALESRFNSASDLLATFGEQRGRYLDPAIHQWL